MSKVKILTKGGRHLSVDRTRQPYADLIKRGDVQVIEENRTEKVAVPEPVTATVTVPDGLHEMRKSELVEWAAENNVSHHPDANMKDIKAAIEAAAGA